MERFVMSDESDRLQAYLEDHLAYEVLMLRHALTKITTFQHPLEWNAYFESFVVHARNLYAFLTNDDDSRTFKARDFINGFQSQKTDETIV